MINIGGIRWEIQIDARNAINNLNNVNAQLNNVTGGFRRGGKAGVAASKHFSKAAAAATSLASALASVKVFDFAKEAAFLAARVENLGTVLGNVGRIANRGAAQIGLIENRVKSLGITTRQTRQALAQMAQANLDLSKSAQLARIAQDAAVIAGINSSDAFERLIISIQRNDVRLLRNLGIVINLNNVYREFTQATGRSAQSLSAFEKQQLVTNKVVERGALIQGTYEAALQDVFKRFTSLDRLTEEATKNFGEQFVPILEKVVDGFSELLKELGDADSEMNNLLGTLGVFTAVTGAVLTAVGAIGAGIATFGSLTIATKGAAAGAAAFAVGAGAASAQAFAASRDVEQMRDRFNDATQAGKELSLQLSQKRGLVRDIQDLNSSLLDSDARLFSARQKLSDLTLAFPDLDKKIVALLNEGNLTELIKLLEQDIPDAYATSQSSQEAFVNSAEFARAEIGAKFDNIRRQIKDSSVEDQTATFRQINNLEVLTNQVLNGQRAVRDLSNAIGSGRAFFGSGAAALGDEFAEFGSQLAALAEQALKFEAAAEQTALNASQNFVNANQERLKILDAGAAQANEIIASAQNDQLRIVKDSGLKQFAEFSARLAALAQQAKVTIADVTEFAAAAETIQLSELRAETEQRVSDLRSKLRNTEQDSPEAKKLQKEIAEALDILRGKEAAIKNEIQEQLEARKENIENARKAIEVTQAALQRRIDLEVGATEALKDQLYIYENGLDPSIAAVTGRIKELTNEQNVYKKVSEDAFKEVANRVNKLTDALQANLLSLAATSNSMFGDVATALRTELAAAQMELDLFTKLREQKDEQYRIRLQNARLDEQRRLQSSLDDQVKAYEQAFGRIVELTGAKNTFANFEQGKQQMDEFKMASEKLDDFFKRFATETNQSGAAGIIFGIREEVKKFKGLIEGIDSKKEAKKLAEIFPEVIKKRVDEARAALKKFQDEQRMGRADQANKDQERFVELTDKGYTVGEATSILQQEQQDRARMARDKEKELKKNVRDAQMEGNAAQKEILALIREERNEINAKLNAQELYLTLQEQEIENEERLALLALQRQKAIALRNAKTPAERDQIEATFSGRESALASLAATGAQERRKKREDLMKRRQAEQAASFSGLTAGYYGGPQARDSSVVRGLEAQLEAEGAGRITNSNGYTPSKKPRTVAERRAANAAAAKARAEAQQQAVDRAKGKLAAEGAGDTVQSAGVKATLEKLGDASLSFPNLLEGINTIADFIVTLKDEVTKASGAVTRGSRR